MDAKRNKSLVFIKINSKWHNLFKKKIKKHTIINFFTQLSFVQKMAMWTLFVFIQSAKKDVFDFETNVIYLCIAQCAFRRAFACLSEN